MTDEREQPTAEDYPGEDVWLWCPRDRKAGVAFLETLDRPTLVVCRNCGEERSFATCPHCGAAGDLVGDVRSRPTSFACPQCHAQIALPPGFYDQPSPLYFVNDLPPEVRARLRQPPNPWAILILVLLLVLGASAVVYFFFGR